MLFSDGWLSARGVSLSSDNYDVKILYNIVRYLFLLISYVVKLAAGTGEQPMELLELDIVTVFTVKQSLLEATSNEYWEIPHVFRYSENRGFYVLFVSYLYSIGNVTSSIQYVHFIFIW